MTTEHTPTPWHRGSTAEGDEYAVNILGPDNQYLAKARDYGQGYQLQEANAAFIVCAVNDHDRLTGEASFWKENCQRAQNHLSAMAIEHDALMKALELADFGFKRLEEWVREEWTKGNTSVTPPTFFGENSIAERVSEELAALAFANGDAT